MTNKYLEKIAAKDDKKDKPYGYAVSGAVAAVGLEPQARNLAALASMGPIDKRITAPHEAGESTLHTVKNFLKTTGLKGKTLLDPLRKQSINNGRGPVYRHQSVQSKLNGEIKNAVMGVKGVHPDIIMHELGHAKDYSKNFSAKMALNQTYAHKYGRLGFGLAASGLLANKKTENYAPVVAVIPGLAQMRSEGAANMHAYKGVAAHKGLGSANKFLARTALPNMAHYGAANAVAPALASLLLLGKKMSRKKGNLDE